MARIRHNARPLPTSANCEHGPLNGHHHTSTNANGRMSLGGTGGGMAGGRFRCAALSLIAYSTLITAMLIQVKSAENDAILIASTNLEQSSLQQEAAGGASTGVRLDEEERRQLKHEILQQEKEIYSLRKQIRAINADRNQIVRSINDSIEEENERRKHAATEKQTEAQTKTETIPTKNRGGEGNKYRAGIKSRPMTEYTPYFFPCAGINLAMYGIDDANAKTNDKRPYKLYEDFNLADMIKGDESWSQLLDMRRQQRNQNLAFYVDKVALKRYLPTIDVPIPIQYHNRYASEMPDNDAFDPLGGMVGSVLEMIPREMSYVAKASHLRGSDGVVLIRYLPPTDGNDDEGRTFIGRYDANMKEAEADQDIPLKTAKYLAKKFKERVGGGLEDDSGDDSPWSLTQVSPGMIIEERISLWDNDKRPAMQFQCLVIWGRVFIARWNRGLSPWGLVSREGNVFEWGGAQESHSDLPDWVDWKEVVRLAEKVGANKDMIRVDIFVGVSADNIKTLDENVSVQARKDAVKIVVSDCELSPPALELEKDPAILEEATRLWLGGYKLGNYRVVPNTEVPDEFKSTGMLSASKMSKTWIKTKFTLAEFSSMGVNLATYKVPPSETDDIGENEEPFELYDNFNIADKITGNENWWDLVAYRRELDAAGLNFYVDKVAQKRWLPTIGMPIPRPFLCRYASELPTPSKNAGIPEEHVTIKTMLPQESNYAAKPSHTSCSDGVWLVKHEDGVTKVAAGGHLMKEADDDALDEIALSLAESLHEDARALESIALKTVAHGFVVEERFTSIEGDDRPAMEFKIFCFWGRVWVANWRRGNNRYGLLGRNGQVIDWAGKKKAHEKLPDWVDWARVVDIAEKMAEHKDAFRVDMFVGLPASSPILKKKDASEEEKKAAVEIVISEFEVHPTTKFVDPRLFDEAARLWLAGYAKLNYKIIPNDEIPKEFLQHPEFPAPEQSREFVETKHTTKNFVVAGVNLGPYRMSSQDSDEDDKVQSVEEPPFALYEDFDISDKITGNEAWWDLIAIRIGLDERPALPFYNDKVALRRYLPSVGIPMPKSLTVKYKSELTETGEESEESLTITNLLPDRDDFVAKPSHSCFGDDVWLVRHHMEDGRNVVSVNGGVGRQKMRPREDFDRAEIGEALTKTLHLEPGTYGSWVYDNIKPGIVVEERFASLDDDNKPAVEFKVFTIWGKCYIAQWRRGVYSGIVYPDGSVVTWGKMKKSNTELPEWVDWSRIKDLAEKMGQNKDMFRTDIFVGVPSDSPALKEGASEEEKRSAVQVVVSEFEMQPGTLQMDPGIFDDAARLWLGGYKMGNYKVVPNTQVPAAYVEKGFLSEEDVP